MIIPNALGECKIGSYLWIVPWKRLVAKRSEKDQIIQQFLVQISSKEDKQKMLTHCSLSLFYSKAELFCVLMTYKRKIFY